MVELEVKATDEKEFLEHLDGVIDYEHPLVQSKIKELEGENISLAKKAEKAFNYVRDEIQHSFDTKSLLITVSASDTMDKREGICFAKSHLLAALLRGMGIPTGFCYQRVLKKGTIDSGYALHGLNALYLEEVGHWIRVDPRGNKEGIHSEFSTTEEKLAYPIREELGEIDYPQIFPRPLEAVLKSMDESKDCHELFERRPQAL